MNRPLHNWLRRLAVLCLLLAHVGLVLRSYAPAAFCAGEPPLRGDVDRYYANAWGAAQAGGLYGYDLSSMAGYPVGLWNSMGKKGFEIAHLLFPWIGLPRLVYLVLVGVACLSPLLVVLALRGSFAPGRGRLILLFLALFYWHVDAQISYFWGFGNVFFPGTACLVIALVAVAVRTLANRANWAWGLLLGLLAAAVFYSHTILILTALVPLLVVGVVRRAAFRQAQPWVGVILAGVVTLALCLPWLVPLWQTRDVCVPQPHRWFPGGPKNLVMDLFSDRAYGRPFDRNVLLQVACVVGVYGLWSTRRQSTLLAIRALAAAAAASLFITYGFPLLNVGSSLQPYRFLIPSVLFLLPAVALGLDAAVGVVARLPTEGRVLVLLLLFLLLPRLTAHGIDLLRPGMPVGVPPAYRTIAEILQREPATARVLCEDAGLGHALPSISGLPVIGGLSSQAFLKHRFAGVDEGGIVFNRGAGAWRPETLTPYLEAYAISHAVLVSPAWIHLAKSAPERFEPIGAVAGSVIYRVRGTDVDYVLEGEADVTIAPRAIRVHNIRRQPLVLKMHADPMLAADQGVQLTATPVLDDPVPFVRCEVPAGITEFTIRW